MQRPGGTRALEQRPSAGLLLIDGTAGQPDDLERFAELVQRTAVPIKMIHPRQEIAAALADHAMGALTWVDATGLIVLRDSLRMLRLTSADQAAEPLPMALSEREFAVLQGLRDGLTYPAIAEALHLGLSTVKVVIQELRRTFKVRTRAALLAASRGVNGAEPQAYVASAEERGPSTGRKGQVTGRNGRNEGRNRTKIGSISHRH